ncbi:50S ribosomal protein L24 [Allopusillimonas soli]|uniref:Large ribosomal subunit protein uL24 n=1 Tax=Allopusillimonas soli TaxID=659016 RepID=A0A853FAT9_9BURK|nr:50S ribosomal protein L24 [Allopusillimonas soli]NYT37213.1 50S ribosomal protein L24 [Allopusillimonas soli]TEA74784.1 50S ribosomal protein L24 [Allopusillimonas soli]
MEKIRKGDEVIVLTGRDKKRRGTVLKRVGPDHVLVEGINVVKKHVRANPMAGTQGGIIDKTMPIHISNVAIYNPESGKGERVAVKVQDGNKVRVFRSSGAVVGAKA